MRLPRAYRRPEEFAVLAHELAHEALHKGERRKQTSIRIRETEAEAVAFVVCKVVGLDTNTASSDYIQLYDGDKETLTASLQAIQQTAAEILAAIRPGDGLGPAASGPPSDSQANFTNQF